MDTQELTQFARESIAPIVIIAALIAGAAHWFVLPYGRAWQEGAARHAALSSEETQRLDVDSITTRVTDIRDRVHEIQRTSALSEDSADLYDLLQQLGQEAGIELGRVNPDTNPAQTKLIHGTSFQISATGSYASALRFISMLSDQPVFSRIEQIDLTPRVTENDERAVALTMRIQFVKFKIAEPLAELAKGES